MEGIEKHFGLVKYVINRYFQSILQFYEYDDLFQTGCLGLIKAVEVYDESKGKFSTIAFSYISGHIKNWIRRDFVIDNDMVYLEDIIEDDFKIIDTLVVKDYSYQQVEDAIMVDSYLKLVTPCQRKFLVGMYMDDKTGTMLSKEFKVSHYRPAHACQEGIDRIRKKIKGKPRYHF